MEYTTDQAKSIFDLIKSVSPYAYPLLVSLILPILWILLKKFMGLSNSDSAETTTNSKWKKVLSSLFLQGDTADKVVFYSCILLFLSGGIFLKIGEHNEEIIRQKALELKKNFETKKYTSLLDRYIYTRGFTEKDLKKIRYNYPSEFIQISDSVTICIDTAVVKNTRSIVQPLLESYLRYEFKTKSMVDLDSLYQQDTIYNVKNFFSADIIYSFLALPENRLKYDITVVNNRDKIVRNE